MSPWLKILVGVMVCMGAVVSSRAESRTVVPMNAAAAIQAIQQAPDPSAVVAAYASALAFAPNDANLHQAYVARMVDMGLPEMAFHQAQILTALQPNNGLAWSVVAYVDARRGQMPDAVAAINLAGQFAPTNKFVAHTAGEIIAWYDLKADKASLPANAKEGLAKIRALLGKQPDYTEAYETARKAYQAQTSSAAPSTEGAVGQNATPSPNSTETAGAYAPQAAAPSDQGTAVTYVQSGTEVPYTTDYYPWYSDWGPSYGYDWGPGWVAPSPWYWWYPCGYWGGCDFFPFGVTFAFGDYDGYHYYHHGYGFGHGGGFGHEHGFGHGEDRGVWHHEGHGTRAFFGSPARPSSSLARWDHQGFGGRSARVGASASTHWWAGGARRSPALATSTATHWWSGAGQRDMAPTSGSRFNSAAPRSFTSRAPIGSRSAGFAWRGADSRQGVWGVAPSTAGRSPTLVRPSPGVAPTTHFWNGTARNYGAGRLPRSTYSAPAFRAPAYVAPRYAMPTARSFGAFHAAPTFRGGWGRTAPAYSAPAPRPSGGFAGGGFHGGSSFHSFNGGFSGRPSGGSSFGGAARGGGFSGGFHGGGRR